LKNVLLNSTGVKFTPLTALADFDFKLSDLCLNIGTENLRICKVDVVDLKSYILCANPFNKTGLKDPVVFGKRKRYINCLRKQKFGNE
jgi:hypothetical protein